MPGFVDKLHKMWNPPDDEYEEYYEDEPERNMIIPMTNRCRRTSFSSFSSRTPQENKVVNINAKAQLQVVLFKPVSFGEETRAIADELLKRHTVVLNLEKTEKDVSRRVVDFLSGVAYANNGENQEDCDKYFYYYAL